MAEVIPFRGILYDRSKVEAGAAVAPPYDIVSPELRKKLYEKSEYNIIKIDFGEELDGDDDVRNKYSRAAEYLDLWLKNGVLIRSPKPCFYAYEMDYTTRDGSRRLQGFFGLVKLTALGKGVFPHEATHSKPKKDRLSLMNACEANTSPIFSIYNSPEKKASAIIEKAAKAKPYIEAKDLCGDLHRLWVIDDAEEIKIITDDLSDKDIIIADGHHRYETALEYQRLLKEKSPEAKASDHVLMFLANTAAGGLTILPTHRIVRYQHESTIAMLSKYFNITTIPLNDDIMEAIKGRPHTFGLYLKEDNSQYILSYKGEGVKEAHPALKGLDVTILHDLVFKEILQISEVLYEMEVSVAEERVRGGSFDAVFFLNPTRVEDVEAVAFSLMRMPPKSTYFYPKVMTGFVINSLKNSCNGESIIKREESQ